MPKATDRCVYRDCKNRRGPGVILFCFPSKKTEKYKRWCHNAGVDQAETQWRMMICNEHFRGKDFTTYEHQKLCTNAEPIDYRQLENFTYKFKKENVVRVYGKSDRSNKFYENGRHRNFKCFQSPLSRDQDDEPVASTSSACVPPLSDQELNATSEFYNPSPPYRQSFNNDPSSSDEEIDFQSDEIKYKLEIERLKRMLTKTSKQLSDLKKATIKQELQPKALPKPKIDVQTFLAMNNVTSDVRKALIELQLRSDNCTEPYTGSQKLLSMKIHYWSGSGYDKLRLLGLQLPHKRTVEKWVAKIDVIPGFIDLSFNDLCEDLNKLPNEAKWAIVKWDMMPLKEFEEYSLKHDIVEGFQDLGPLGRTEDRANYVVVITLNGLHSLYRWRILAGFFFVRNVVNENQMVAILKLLLDKAKEIGLNVKMAVCKQSPSNVKCYKLLKVTVKNPIFQYQGKKIFTIHDFSHEIKHVIKALLKYEKLYMNGKILYLSDMKAVWDVDQQGKLSSNFNHITKEDFPNSFEKMNAQKARHLFSNKLAKAMIEADEKGFVISNTLRESAECILLINNLIEVARSSKMKDACHLKSALSIENQEARKVFYDFLSWAPTLKVVDKKGNMKSLSCFQRLEMTVRGLVELFDNLSSEKPTVKLCTNLCTTESVERLLLRIRGGFNSNPTCRMFCLKLRYMLSLKHNMAASHRVNITDENDDNVGYDEVNAAELEGQAQELETYEIAAVSAVAYAEEKCFSEDHILTDNLQFHSDFENATTEEDKVANDSGDDSEYYDDDRGSADDNEINDSQTHDYVENLLYKNNDDFMSILNCFESSLPFKAYSGIYDENTISYLASYTANATVKKWSCDRCSKLLLKSSEDNLDDTYIESREYESRSSYKVTLLKKSSKKFQKIVTANLLSFENVIKYTRYNLKVIENLEKRAIRDLSQVYPDWFSESQQCHKHRLFAMTCLFKAKLHRICAIDNRERKSLDQQVRWNNTFKGNGKAVKRKSTTVDEGKPNHKLRNLINT